MKPDLIAIQAERRIFLLRGQKVMLDLDLAELYGVETKALDRAMKRNRERFPADFAFQLTAEEDEALRCQIGASNAEVSQTVTPKPGRGGRRYRPYAFTEQGVAMLSSVLRSSRAVQVNMAIMRAFVRLRELLLTNTDLARKLDAIEKKYDAQFRVVFDAIRQLMAPPDPQRGRIGFHGREKSIHARRRHRLSPTHRRCPRNLQRTAAPRGGSAFRDEGHQPHRERCAMIDGKDTAGYDSLFESVRGIAQSVHALNHDALRAYAPVVEAILRSRSPDPRRIEHTVDRLLDFCGYEPVLDLYKKLCRHYWDIDPAATASYVHAYRDMWDSESQK